MGSRLASVAGTLGVLTVALLFVACGGAGSRGPEVVDPDDVVASYYIGRLVEEFGFSESDVDIDRLPYVLESNPHSRILLLAAYSGSPCEQAPTIQVRQAEDALQIGITPRRADPDADCDAMAVAWVVELRLRDVLGDRSVAVSLATASPTGP